jgi:uncharacterized protein
VAGSSFFMLLDDIAVLLDDVAVMSKSAVSKTAGVLGDDLALNAQQVSGVNPERELPVVWAVAKGSFINKCLLVPAALALNAFLPKLVVPLLMLGGAYLCFEGIEKLAHKYLHTAKEDAQHHSEHLAAVDDETLDMVAFERDKIKGAIRTDFILSAEIIVIALGVVKDASFLKQVLALSAVAVFITVGVYGLVAAIVKMDDLGLYWTRASSQVKRSLGALLLAAAPKLMRFLSFAGTLAMFLVGGQIIAHGVAHLHHMQIALQTWAGGFAGIGGAASMLSGMVFDLVVGMLTGTLCLAAFLAVQRARGKRG